MSQVIETNVNQLLVTLWDDPGYYKIDRKQGENTTITYIEDYGGIEDNVNCTDLIQISTENEENASYQHYIISRTKSALNIIDTIKDKVYCLYQERNYLNKLSKVTIMARDFNIKGTYNKDKIQFQLVIVTE